MYGTPRRVACFTEATVDDGVPYLIWARDFGPWGIVFRRKVVWDAGGGPVFYVRADKFGNIWRWPKHMRSRCVKLDPGKTQWLWEREWRIPLGRRETSFKFDRADVEAVIVGTRHWPPLERTMVFNPMTNAVQEDWVEPEWANVTRWWWDEDEGILHT